MHRILPVNSFLYKCGLKESELSSFCIETKANLLNIFWNCNLIKTFCFLLKNFVVICGIALPLTAMEVTLGISESYIENQNTVNNILLILKCYIYRCRCKGGNSTLTRISSESRILYYNREKFHFLLVPQTNRAN